MKVGVQAEGLEQTTIKGTVFYCNGGGDCVHREEDKGFVSLLLR